MLQNTSSKTSVVNSLTFPIKEICLDNADNGDISYSLKEKSRLNWKPMSKNEMQRMRLELDHNFLQAEIMEKSLKTLLEETQMFSIKNCCPNQFISDEHKRMPVFDYGKRDAVIKKMKAYEDKCINADERLPSFKNSKTTVKNVRFHETLNSYGNDDINSRIIGLQQEKVRQTEILRKLMKQIGINRKKLEIWALENEIAALNKRIFSLGLTFTDHIQKFNEDFRDHSVTMTKRYKTCEQLVSQVVENDCVEVMSMRKNDISSTNNNGVEANLSVDVQSWVNKLPSSSDIQKSFLDFSPECLDTIEKEERSNRINLLKRNGESIILRIEEFCTRLQVEQCSDERLKLEEHIRVLKMEAFDVEDEVDRLTKMNSLCNHSTVSMAGQKTDISRVMKYARRSREIRDKGWSYSSTIYYTNSFSNKLPETYSTDEQSDKLPLSPRVDCEPQMNNSENNIGNVTKVGVDDDLVEIGNNGVSSNELDDDEIEFFYLEEKRSIDLEPFRDYVDLKDDILMPMIDSAVKQLFTARQQKQGTTWETFDKCLKSMPKEFLQTNNDERCRELWNVMSIFDYADPDERDRYREIYNLVSCSQFYGLILCIVKDVYELDDIPLNNGDLDRRRIRKRMLWQSQFEPSTFEQLKAIVIKRLMEMNVLTNKYNPMKRSRIDQWILDSCKDDVERMTVTKFASDSKLLDDCLKAEQLMEERLVGFIVDRLIIEDCENYLDNRNS